MTAAELAVALGPFLGETDAGQTWSHDQRLAIAQMAFRHLGSFGVVRGYEDVVGDGGREYTIPSNILTLTHIVVGDQIYRPVGPRQWVRFHQYDLTVFRVDDSEQSVTMPVDVAASSTLEFHGRLRLPPGSEIIPTTPEGGEDPAPAAEFDSRYDNLLTYYAVTLLLAQTEDSVENWRALYRDELARFGLRHGAVGRVAYWHVHRVRADY